MMPIPTNAQTGDVSTVNRMDASAVAPASAAELANETT